MVSIINAVRDVDRLREITQVLVRHGLGELAARIGLNSLGARPPEGTATPTSAASFAQRLRLVLQDLGPSFVKLGQIVSTRPDLIPPEVITELKKLQDNVLPIPFEEVRAQIEETLGAPIESVYAWFDEKPLASASIGQVHRARLRLVAEGAAGGGAAGPVAPAPDGPAPAALAAQGPPGGAHGTAGAAASLAASLPGAPLPSEAAAEVVEVVVKVQRPRIRGMIERDLDLLHFLARVIERAIPESRVYSPTGLVDEFDRAIMAELDFTVEAQNAERFAENFAGHPVARFPRVYRQALGKKVLTLEFLEGKKVYDAVAGGVSGEYIARKSVGIVVKMIFEDGFFHADPHPGNILILTPDGDLSRPLIGLIDLGLVGELTDETRDKAIDLMVAAIRGDAEALGDAMLQIGRPRGKVDMTAYRQTVRKLSSRYLGKPLKEIELSALIRDLVQAAIRHGIDIPTELSLVGKALMTIEGIGKELYPDLDVWEEARPFVLNLVMRRYHPLKVGQELWREVARLTHAARTLPAQIHEILDDLRRGELTVRTRDPEMGKALDRLGRRVWSALMSVGLLAAGVLLLIDVPSHHRLAYLLITLALLVGCGHLIRDALKR